MSTPAQVVAELAHAARLTAYDADTGRSWYDALFDTDADGAPVLAPDQPDRALLLALAEEYAALARHADTLPASVHLDWLTRVLGIDRLPVVPDRVVAAVQVDPKLAPAVVERGTVLRGGKDAFGNERRYRTVDALTAHGAALAGVRSLAPGGTAGGLPGVAASAPDFPLTPLMGPDAPHVLRVSSPALAFSGGQLVVRVTFEGSGGTSALSGAGWRYSRADGGVTVTTASPTGNGVVLVLTDDCGAPDGDPWVEWAVPATHPLPESFGFTGVKVAVEGRSPYVPEAAYFNDGLVDVTKEFQPFGAVAKRGDAFYLRSDEAFGKDLEELRVTVDVLDAGGAPLSPALAGTGLPSHLALAIGHELAIAVANLGGHAAAIQGQLDNLGSYLEPSGEPTVRWQRRVGGRWQSMGPSTDEFDGVHVASVGGGSEPTSISGQEGRYVRAFLSEGDFGWQAYLDGVAAFATGAVAGDEPTMPTPPTPPIASRIQLSYTTRPVAATRVEATSGWRRTVAPATGTFRPFRRAVSETGATGMVAVGLELPGAATGSTVSLFFEVDSSAPCGNVDPVDAGWEWWDGTGWQELPVADGSRQLRESGLLRFVAPSGWATGCADVGADTGRWLRLVTTAPDRLGTVRTLVVDAVLAEFVSAAADPQADPSPATALPPGTIKGTLTPVRGVKKVTNLASVPGRGPEGDAAYRSRASTRVRHRDRALVPWDYEQHVALAFPEVAAVRCLPHTDRDGDAPGVVGLVVVPDRVDLPDPRPSVSLIGRITDALAPRAPIGARMAVLCPAYAAVTVVASIRLRRGVAALTGQQEIAAALEATLHPTRSDPPRWGRGLYASTLIAFLEQQPSVDVVTAFELRDAAGVAVETVEVDPCRGLYCSSGAHVLTCEEQL